MDREDHELTSFRQEWQRELKSSSCRTSAESTPKCQSPQLTCESSKNLQEALGEIKTDVEKKAAEFFNHGVQLEESGQLYESIKYYKRAISLVPDIEFRVHQRYMQEREGIVGNQTTNSPNDEGQDNDEELDLVCRFESFMSLTTPFCQPQYRQEATHISCLPQEMLDQILLWVISDQLDFNSLERMSVVCRGLYIACRNPEIWRKACNSVWQIANEDMSPYASWRQMYITRPRPKFNGCYISQTTYFRCGESGFQDYSNYQQYHFVSYYRYLRFFPDGVILMFVSSEEPHNVIGHLKNREPVLSQILSGQFHIHDSSVTMIFRHKSPKSQQYKNRNKVGTTDIKETTYQLEFEIKNPRGRTNHQMQWSYYSIVSSAFNGKLNTSVIDVSNQDSFPHLNFSRVKRFDTLSERPL